MLLYIYLFNRHFYCTKELDTWWRAYHAKKFLGALMLLRYLTDALTLLQIKLKNGRSQHIKETQTFQCYFETVYNPNDLCRTICDATFILKEKLIAKFLELKIPHYMKDRYTFALNYYPPKFPPFLRSELSLAF